MPQPLGRHAPPASVTSDGGLAWRLFQPALAAVGAGVGSFWLAQHALVAGWMDAWGAQPARSTSPAGLWLTLAPALLMALWVGGLTWRRSAQPPHTLAWNGQGWLLNGEPVALQTRLDLQRWLLLRAQAPCSRPTWVALSARHASGAAWHGLRAALYSAAPPTSAPPAGGPSP